MNIYDAIRLETAKQQTERYRQHWISFERIAKIVRRAGYGVFTDEQSIHLHGYRCRSKVFTIAGVCSINPSWVHYMDGGQYCVERAFVIQLINTIRQLKG